MEDEECALDIDRGDELIPDFATFSMEKVASF